jgi:hypothetical protein
MPAKFIFRMLLVVAVALLALILNAEGKLLANETPVLMLLVVLFIAGGAALNFVQIQHWRQQHVDSQASPESSDNMIAEDRLRLTRKYRRWLLAMPVLYVIGLFGGGQMPLWMRILFTAFAICAYSYVLFVYKRTKRPY